jgi:hypothetical protein
VEGSMGVREGKMLKEEVMHDGRERNWSGNTN